MGKNSSESVGVNVTFSGTINVSASRNKARVTVAKKVKGGAAVRANRNENVETRFIEPANVDEDFPVDAFLQEIYEQSLLKLYFFKFYYFYLFIFFDLFFPNNLDEREQETLSADEVGVLVAHGGRARESVRCNKRRAAAKVHGGFVVGERIKVTKK